MHPIQKDSWTIENEPWNRILRHTASGYPAEACGILLCSRERPLHITEAHPARNTTPEDSATRYLIDPLDFIHALEWAEQSESEICGFYHSHPDHPPVPSEYDRKTAWEDYLYIILTIRDGVFEESRAWKWAPEKENFQEVLFQSPACEDKDENTISPA